MVFLAEQGISSAPDDIVGRYPVNLRKTGLASSWGWAGCGFVSDPFAFWNMKRFGCAVLTDITHSGGVAGAERSGAEANPGFRATRCFQRQRRCVHVRMIFRRGRKLYRLESEWRYFPG